MSTTVGKLAKHVHHNILYEVLTKPISFRRRVIRKTKPKAEQATRLRLLGVVKGPLPKRVAHTVEAYHRAWEAYDDACKAYNRVMKDYAPQLERLHAKECPNCPWNGETIFP